MARREAFIFLDVDGVANNKAYRDLDLSKDRVDPNNVELINQLINSVSKFAIPEVILISSWRLPGEPGPQKTLDLLRAAGYAGPAFRGATPDLHPLFRGDEIRVWMSRYVQDNPTTSTLSNFVILDDVVPLVQHVSNIYIRQRWVQTCDAYGITAADVAKAIDMLRKGAQ